MAKRRRKPGSIGLRLLRFGQERVETYVPGGSTLHRKPEDTTWMEALSPTMYDASDFDAELYETNFIMEDSISLDDQIALEPYLPPQAGQKPVTRVPDESTHAIPQQPVKPMPTNPTTSDTKPASAPLIHRSASPNNVPPVKRAPSNPNVPVTQPPPRKTPPDLLAILEAHEGKRRHPISDQQPEQAEATTPKITSTPRHQEQIQRAPKQPSHDSTAKRPRRAQLHEITPYSKQKAVEAEEAEISENEQSEKPSLGSLHEDDFTHIDEASPFASFTVDEVVEADTQIDTEITQNTQRHANDEQPLNADIADQSSFSEERIDHSFELSGFDEDDFDYDGETIKLDNDIIDVPESDPLPLSSPDKTVIQPQHTRDEVIERKTLNIPKTVQPPRQDSALSQDETNNSDSPESYMHAPGENYQLPSFDELSDLEEGIPTEQMTPIDSPTVLQPQLESPFTYFAGPKALPQMPTAREQQPRIVEKHEGWSNTHFDANASSVAHHENVDTQSQPSENHELSESYDDPIIAESEFELNSYDDEDDETALMTFDRPYPSGKIHRQLEILTPTSTAEIHDNVDDSIPQSDSPEADLLRLLNLPPDTPVAGLTQNKRSTPQKVQRQVQSGDDTNDYEHPMQAIPLDIALLNGVETSQKTTTAPLQRLSFEDRSAQTSMTDHTETQGDDSAEDVDTKGQDNVNVDKLARDVLKRLRHRLRIEQERGTKR